MIKLHFFVLFFILVFAVSAIEPVSAKNKVSCIVLIESNDPGSRVYVNGVSRGTPPLKLSCKKHPQVVKVISSTEQTFTRVFPSIFQASLGDLHWSVHFREPADGLQFAGEIADSRHIEVKNTRYEEAMLKELRELKGMIAQLFQTHPELAMKVAKKVQSNSTLASGVAQSSPARAVSSVLSPSPFPEGFYVQLHTLTPTQFEIARKQNILAENVEDENIQVRHCHWRGKEDSPILVRVVLGPFQNMKQAKTARELIGRDTYALKTPHCYQGRLASE